MLCNISSGCTGNCIAAPHVRVQGMKGTTERYDPKACCKCDEALLGSGYVSVPMVVNIGGIRKTHANAREACYYNVNHHDLCRYNGPLIDWKRDYGDC